MNLQELLQLGESYHQEFKETIDKSLVHEIYTYSFSYKKTAKNNVTNNQPRLTQILDRIRSNPKVTTNELVLRFAFSKRTILRDINKLKQSYIRKDGNGSDSIWEIITQEQSK